jgi:hypothetical protein
MWSALIAALVVVEVAEITHLFTLPIELAFGDPLAVVVALVFTTILALVGAIFIGVYVSARVLRTQGFTPFEEEMLRMRNEVSEIKAALAARPPTGGATRSPPETPKGGTP